MSTEKRYAEGSELRVAGDSTNKLVGYAAVFGKPSQTLVENGRRFREVIQPGAFSNTLASGAEVLADVGHEAEAVIASRSEGTLTLTEDDTGLLTEMDLDPSDPDAARALSKVRRRSTKGMSFEFQVNPNGEQWAKQPDGTWLRTLTDLNLLRVTVTATPAYPDTSVAVRSLVVAEAKANEVEKVEEVKAEPFVMPARYVGMMVELANAKLKDKQGR